MGAEQKQAVIDFGQYIRQGDNDVREKAEIWQTAIGLQAVDGLQTSQFLRQTAREHIEGHIDIDDTRRLIKEYYQKKSSRDADDDRMEEADKVSANITRVLSTRALAFNSNGYISIHRRIFDGVFKHAGKLRDYDISKMEWVLDGDSVSYLNWEDLRRALDYDIECERQFSYSGLSMDEVVRHISEFVSRIWQIHPFREGNTRTTAVFTILYLRSIGFSVGNNLFADHSWYFRNALVRANYKNALKGIDYSPEYLERFFRNLLLGEEWVLRNRYLHVSPTEEWRVQPRIDNPLEIGQAPVQVPVQVPVQDYGSGQNQFLVKNPLVKNLIMALGDSQMSIKQMMGAVSLKHRANFMEYHLNPSISGGFVMPLYPDKPNHPRQKYYLSVKGLAIYNNLK